MHLMKIKKINNFFIGTLILEEIELLRSFKL